MVRTSRSQIFSLCIKLLHPLLTNFQSETQQRAKFVSYGEIKTELKVETKPGQGPATLTRFPGSCLISFNPKSNLELGLCIEKACSNIENLLANLMAILMEQNGVTGTCPWL